MLDVKGSGPAKSWLCLIIWPRPRCRIYICRWKVRRALTPRKVRPYGFVFSLLSPTIFETHCMLYSCITHYWHCSGRKRPQGQVLRRKVFERQQFCHHTAFISPCYYYLNSFERQNRDCSNLPKAFALNPMFQSIEWEDWISPDAWEEFDPGNLTPSPSPEPAAPVDMFQDFPHLCQFLFDNNQLQYLLVNSTLAGGRNSIREIATVLRYKWPSEFRQLSDLDLETALLSVNSHSEATL